MQRNKIILVLFFVLTIGFPSRAFAITASDAQKYANERLFVQGISSSADDLKAKLDYEINRMIDLYNSKGHIQAEFTNIGITRYYNLFMYPGEVVNVLSDAYPYVTQATQTRIKTYLNSEIRSYDPTTTPTDWCNKQTFGSCEMTGNRREYFSIPTSPNPDPLQPNIWPPIILQPDGIYMIWRYAETTGDWAFISTTTPASGTRFNAIKNMFNSIPNTPTRYGQVAGAIGYARILKHFGMTTDTSYNTALTVIQNGLTAGTSFSTFMDTAQNTFTNNVSGSHDWAFVPFHYLRQENAVGILFAPEIGRFLTDFALNDVRTRVTVNPNEGQAGQKNAIESHWPEWYVFRGSYPPIGLWANSAYGENHMISPDTPWALFMIHAYTYNEPGATLRKYIGAPYAIGDLTYIQKLTGAIEGYGTKIWSETIPITTITPSPTPNIYGNGDANTDGVINTLDIKTVLQNWLASLTTSIDQYKDGRINALDAVRVIKMIP